MADYPFQHPGGCDCGAVQFTYHCHQPLAELAARACQCEYCLPRAASYLSDSDALLVVQVKDSRYLYAHSFGTRTADFMHCAVCNTLVYVKSEIDGRDYALVAAPALAESQQLKISAPVDYDGEALAQRLQRRSQRWIAHVEIVEVGS